MKRHSAAAVLATALVLGGATSLAAQQLGYTGSVGLSTGDYIFTERTTSISFYNGLDVRAGRFRLSAGIPVVVQNSAALTAVGGMMLPTGGPDYRAVRDRSPGAKVPMRKGAGSGSMSGMSAAIVAGDTIVGPSGYETNLGDPVLHAGLELVGGVGALRSLEITFGAKAPLNDLDSGVGTGEWDYGGGAGVTLSAERVLLFADASYWHYGDLPEMPLRDGVGGSAGIGLPVGPRGSLLVSVSGGQSVVPGLDGYASIDAMGAYHVSPVASLSAGIGAGLTESSPGLTLQLGWHVVLARSGERALNQAGSPGATARVAR